MTPEIEVLKERIADQRALWEKVHDAQTSATPEYNTAVEMLGLLDSLVDDLAPFASIEALKGYVQHTPKCNTQRHCAAGCCNGRHTPACMWVVNHDCTCGLNRLLASLDPAVEGTMKNLDTRMVNPGSASDSRTAPTERS